MLSIIVDHAEFLTKGLYDVTQGEEGAKWSSEL